MVDQILERDHATEGDAVDDRIDDLQRVAQRNEVGRPLFEVPVRRVGPVAAALTPMVVVHDLGEVGPP